MLLDVGKSVCLYGWEPKLSFDDRIFYLNLPVCAVALAVLFAFLRTRYKKDTMGNSLKLVYLGGNALLIASVVAVLIALTWGGTQYVWSSF